MNQEERRENEAQDLRTKETSDLRTKETSASSSSDFDEGKHLHKKSVNGIKGIINNPYVFFTAIFASIGGILFGYDQGVISGVQEMDDFVTRFPMNSTQTGFMVSILELGAWAGSWIIGYFADRIGRKYSIVLTTIVFLLGSGLQAGAQNVSFLLASRFITGMGVGALSLLVPLYQSEIAPPEIRGSLLSLQQLAICFGILISFWIDYGCANITGQTSWRVPFAIQIAFAIILGVGILFFPFSPRWLMTKDRDAEALTVIAKLRRLPEDHPVVVEEWKEIKATIEFDRQVQREQYPQYADAGSKGKLIVSFLGYRDLFRKGNFKRVFIGAAIMFFQQFTGVNAVIYYAPKVFKSIGLTGQSVSLLATGVVGIINFVGTIPTVLFLDVFGRKTTLMCASALMGVSMIVIAIITAKFQDDWPNHTAAGWVNVAFIYIFIANFAYGWGPIPWAYTAEIFPLRIRAKAMSVSTSSNWMCNFVIGLITPIMLENITYGTYIFFACFCAIAFVFIWFYVPETKGVTLEEMDDIFGGHSAVHDAEMMKQVQNRVAEVEVPNKKTEV